MLVRLDPTFHSKVSGVSQFGRGWLSSKYSLVIDVLYQHREKEGTEGRALNAADGDTASRLIGRAGGGTSQRQQWPFDNQ